MAYRHIAALLHHEGWEVNDRCVERLWRQEAAGPVQNNRTNRAYGLSTAHAFA